MQQLRPTHDQFLNQRYELAGRVIDPLVGTLIWQNETRHLRRKQLLVLAILANAGGAFVARQTLIEQIWDGNAFVGDVGVTDTISALRRSLDDGDRSQPLIRTIPRGGYVLAVPVRLLDVAPPAFTVGAAIPGKPGWHLLRALIENAVSQTWLATGPDAALRVFRFCRNEAHLRLLQREVTLLRYLRETLAGRTDIAGISDWQLEEPPYFLEMRHTTHGNLADYALIRGGLAQIALADRMRWITEIAAALAAVHAVSIVHHNISADCIFLDSGSDRLCAKLGEFGLGELTDRTRLEALKITALGLTLAGNDAVGAQMYLAPERRSGQAATAASDVYALGVLLYQLYIGDLTRAPGAEWAARIESLQMRTMIAACIDPDAAQRPTSDVLSAQLQAFAAASDSEKPVSAAAAQPSVVTPEPNSAGLPASMLGQSIGPYRLMDKLGEGGMGTVYLAEQRDPVQRQVAVKLVKAGMDTAEVLARFEAERQALALMNHVNVAAVYDAGATPMGRPYFAMEYVPGLEITAHCDDRELNFRQRIALFLQVCDGVLHAHQKGIIHRDLKPSNILIKTAQGQPATAKIIDFGVAKSLQRKLGNLTAHTQLGSFVGTRMYSSPEQISGNASALDTRCDIYSLGVVLYELLTGVAPYSEEDLASKSPVELTRMLSHEEPPPLLARFVSLDAQRETDIAARRQMTIAQMKQTLGSDLSWIVAKCLERDPNARYATVLALQNDLQRWLKNRPVEARPATLTYRLRKMVRRNRTAVILGTAITFALLGTTTAAIIGFLQARSAAVEAEAAADFQVKQLSSLNPGAMGNGLREALLKAMELSAKERGLDAAAVKEAQQKMDALLVGVDFTDLTVNQLGNYIFSPALETVKKDYDAHPELQARLWQSLADMLRGLGQNQQAIAPQELALAARARLFGDRHPLYLESLTRRGALFLAMGKLPEAEVDLQRAATLLRRQLGKRNPETLDALNFLSAVIWQMGQLDQAELLYTEVLEGRKLVLGVEHPDTLKTMTALGHVKLRRGKLDLAEALLETALKSQRRVLGNGQRDTLNTISELANVYARQNRIELAEPYLREGIAGIRKLLGSEHLDTMERLNDFAVFLMVYGRLEQAEAQLREILTIQARSPGVAAGAELLWKANLADVLLQTGRLDEADSILLGAMKGDGVSLGSGHPNMLRVCTVLAQLRQEQGRFEDAATIYRALADAWQRTSGAESVNVFRALDSLAYILQLQGRLDEAEKIQMKSLIGLRKYSIINPDSASPWIAESHYGGLLKRQGKIAEAEAQYRKALVALRRFKLPQRVINSLDCMLALSQLLREQGELPEALALARDAAEGSRRMLDKRDHGVGVFLTEYGRALSASGLLKDAEPVFEEAWGRLRAVEGVNPAYFKDVIEGFIGLYEASDKVEPGQGFGKKIEIWRKVSEAERLPK
jgi:eukaryotic-like serine/threonine-protein kinase